MRNIELEHILEKLKMGIIWILATVIFTTQELRQEAWNHYHKGTVRIPGVCYGYNLIKGYQAISHVFPDRCRAVRLDFVLGYIKMLILLACALSFFLLMASRLS
jgi:hypothetical protein